MAPLKVPVAVLMVTSMAFVPWLTAAAGLLTQLRVALTPDQRPLEPALSASLSITAQSAGVTVDVGVKVGEQTQGVGVRVAVGTAPRGYLPTTQYWATAARR